MAPPNLVAQISPEAVRQNLAAIRRRITAGALLCPAVKADSYGHGIEHILPILASAGVDRVAVANMDEACRLRELGWRGAILCLGAPLAWANVADRREIARAAAGAEVNCTVTSQDDLDVLTEVAGDADGPVRVEVKIDTGMGRMGLLPSEAVDFILGLRSSSSPRRLCLQLSGVYSHFATADGADIEFTREQLAVFTRLTARLRECGASDVVFHAANSAAIFRLPESHLDMVRPGLSLYGYWDGPPEERPADLVPIMRLIGRLIAIRRLPAGHGVGYGRTFVTSRESLIGVVPIGYEDGYRRLLSNNAVMTLEAARGQPRRLVPVVGRISMDLTSVDLTDAGDVQIGDPVTIIDNDPKAPNSVENFARKLDTISYEVTCLLGQRIRRVSV